jgi:hypothetical protein
MGNNPVMGIDPDGEFVWFIPIAVGIISGGINVAANWGAIQAAGGGWAAMGAAASSFGVGFAAGALSTAGATALAPIILPALGTGFLGGAALGAVGGGIGGFISGAGNTWLNGGSFGQGLAAGGIGIASGAGLGALTGGTFSGLKSVFQGRDFWTGAIKNFRQPTLNLNQSNVNVNQNFPARTAPGVEPQVAGRGPGGGGNVGGGGNGGGGGSLMEGSMAIDIEMGRVGTNGGNNVLNLTTSSRSLAPSRTYSIYRSNGQLYKFGVTDANLARYEQSLKEAGKGAFGKFSSVMPKSQAHLMEKYLRSLHFNTTGQYALPGMKVPYPVNFNTGLRIRP